MASASPPHAEEISDLSARVVTNPDPLLSAIEKLSNLVGNMNEKFAVSRGELPEHDEYIDEEFLLHPEKRTRLDMTSEPSVAGTEEFIDNMLNIDASACSKNDSETSDNIIDALAQEMNVHESVGAPINEQIIKWVHSLLKEKMSEDKLKEKMAKYPKPENSNLVAPTVNRLIWSKLTVQTRSVDLKFQKTQKSFISGLNALMMLTQELLKVSQKQIQMDHKALITMAMESLALFLHGNYELNLRRREMIKPDLHRDYHPLCSASNPISELLFGDDISKEVREITDSNRVGNQVFGRGARGYGRGFQQGRARSRGSRQHTFLGRGRSSCSRGRRPQQNQSH